MIEIMNEVSCLSQNLRSTREGRLNYVYNIFMYLQKNISNNPGRIEFDPACVHTDDKVSKGSKRQLEDWKDFYLYASEAHMRKKLEILG